MQVGDSITDYIQVTPCSNMSLFGQSFNVPATAKYMRITHTASGNMINFYKQRRNVKSRHVAFKNSIFYARLRYK